MSVYQGSTDLFQNATLVIASPFPIFAAHSLTSSPQPSVSQASLPQLTVDVLVHSLGLRRLGKLQDDEMVVPMVGEAEVEEGLASGGIEGMSFAFFVRCLLMRT